MRWAITVVLTVVVIGCGSPLAGPPEDVGQACAARFSGDRCDAITAFVAESLQVAPGEIRALMIQDEPEPSVSPGIIVTRSGGGEILLVHAQLGDGSTEVVKLFCVGVSPSHDAPCMDTPRVPTWATGSGGYGDSTAAATPLPTLEPSAVAAAEPLRIPHRTIAVGRTGRFTVDLGIVRLPNGVLTASGFELADPWPDGIVFTSEGVGLTLTPVDPDAPPFESLDQHGWRPGVEAALVTLQFEVLAVEPGASFDIVDVLVA